MNQNYNNNKYEILDNNSASCEPRYPLAKTPYSELQNMNYKDWLDTSTAGEEASLAISTRTAVKTSIDIVSVLLSAIPIPGFKQVGGILKAIFPFLWPEPQIDIQKIWKEFMEAAEQLVDKKIAEYARSKALAELAGVYNTFVLYQDAAEDFNISPNDPAAQERIRTQFRATNTVMEFAMPSFRATGFEIPLLSVYAEAANLHLLLLRDAVNFGASWGLPKAEIDDRYRDLQTRTTVYTDYCTSTYDQGTKEVQTRPVDLSNNTLYPWCKYDQGDYYGYPLGELKRYSKERYDVLEKWNQYNSYRRDMTLMVLDIVSVWPTYDKNLYPNLNGVKGELTRELYTDIRGSTFPLNSIAAVEAFMIPRPDLFRWLMAMDWYWSYITEGNRWTAGQIITGLQKKIQKTLSPQETLPLDGQTTGNVARPGATFDHYWTEVTTQQWFENRYLQMKTNRGIVSLRLGTIEELSPFYPTGPKGPIYDPSTRTSDIPNHRLSWVSYYPVPDAYNNAFFTYPLMSQLSALGLGWTHNNVDPNNTIVEDRITQIPAVKGYLIDHGATVVRGPGNTGGNLVRLPAYNDQWTQLRVKVRPNSSALSKTFRLRIRYASESNANLFVGKYVDEVNGYYETGNYPVSQTFSGSMTYSAFKYLDIFSMRATESEFKIELRCNSGTINIDKIEFIPINGSLEAYQANQNLEEARKAVNALFTNEAKNALQLDVTDYAVDQAANLAECVSDEFHAQEKMILLDQVKFAKRLSQARNLLNYGDFESADWSDENGWRTSHHVSVRSDNPIFKGRYLYMPGAISTQLSSHVYPTYVYQKVDESKLKSYTRYLVRGFIGNSKDLELLVERYGKDVHVEMDVPNDIQYTLPMNECGGFDRCRPASYQARPPHTCTCNDTDVAHTDCQCKDKGNRTSTNTYTNVPTDNAVYRNGSHNHKSCGYKDPHVFTYHIDTGCVDQEENLGLFFALKIASENGVANIDNLEIIEAQPLTGEALARVKKREQKWKQEMAKKQLETERAVQAAQDAIQLLFTNAQYNRLQFETLFPQIVRAEWLVQQIPYVHHPFLSGALLAVPGMNFEIVQQLSTMIGNAHALYEGRNLVHNGTFSSGTENWNVSAGVKVQTIQHTSVLVLSEWNHEASQQLRIDPDRGYVLRVTARKEGAGKGTVTMSDGADYTETLTFTSCDYNTIGTQTMTGGTLSGFVTKTLEIFPDTDRIRIDIGETEGTFKIESVELICMEQMEDHLYDMAGNLEEEMQALEQSNT
ncbi:hypothetical protein CUC43_33410 (plasmid) [Bacillus thuringiensis LM1212]|nr:MULTISPECIES: insecticidal delta-endotoxin Cry8Ea1 family protein [Bacillus cereus group]AXY11484.1 hypothetical protein CUC43_33410 [Bacillus thuringiensis LM1212]QDF27125.1 hypothetical protein FJR70_30275 [Bacillus tropicus]QUG99222.1 hypothetical protein HCM98_30830 [Bacillus tropicus]